MFHMQRVWLKNNILKPLAKQTKPVRFFNKKEWATFNDKEKLWITYKHYWMLKGQGDAEISIVEAIIIQLITWATVLQIWGFDIWLMVFAPFILLFSWWIKYVFGNYKDKKDLIALETEIGNRRNKVFREIRTKKKKKRKKRN